MDRTPKIFKMELGGRTMEVEIGRLANLAGGAALMKYGDTNVLVTATAARKVEKVLTSSHLVVITKKNYTL